MPDTLVGSLHVFASQLCSVDSYRDFAIWWRNNGTRWLTLLQQYEQQLEKPGLGKLGLRELCDAPHMQLIQAISKPDVLLGFSLATSAPASHLKSISGVLQTAVDELLKRSVAPTADVRQAHQALPAAAELCTLAHLLGAAAAVCHASGQLDCQKQAAPALAAMCKLMAVVGVSMSVPVLQIVLPVMHTIAVSPLLVKAAQEHYLRPVIAAAEIAAAGQPGTPAVVAPVDLVACWRVWGRYFDDTQSPVPELALDALTSISNIMQSLADYQLSPALSAKVLSDFLWGCVQARCAPDWLESAQASLPQWVNPAVDSAGTVKLALSVSAVGKLNMKGAPLSIKLLETVRQRQAQPQWLGDPQLHASGHNYHAQVARSVALLQCHDFIDVCIAAFTHCDTLWQHLPALQPGQQRPPFTPGMLLQALEWLSLQESEHMPAGPEGVPGLLCQELQDLVHSLKEPSEQPTTSGGQRLLKETLCLPEVMRQWASIQPPKLEVAIPGSSSFVDILCLTLDFIYILWEYDGPHHYVVWIAQDGSVIEERPNGSTALRNQLRNDPGREQLLISVPYEVFDNLQTQQERQEYVLKRLRETRDGFSLLQDVVFGQG